MRRSVSPHSAPPCRTITASAPTGSSVEHLVRCRTSNPGLLLETAEFGLIRYSAAAVRSCTTGPNIKVKTAAAANNAAAVTRHPTKPPH